MKRWNTKMNYKERLDQVFFEAISKPDLIRQAIYSRMLLKIHYTGDDNTASGERIIEPYVFGTLRSTANIAIRAYQKEGDSMSGIDSGWKLFLVNNISSISIVNEYFRIRDTYRRKGDKHFSHIRVKVEE